MTEFRYYDYAVGAKENAVYSSETAYQNGSGYENLKVGVPKYNYSSFEFNSYDPDNPRKLMKETDILAYSSAIQSSEDCSFTNPIVITVEFSEYFIINGLTLHSKAVITSGQIAYYRDGTIIENAVFDFSATDNDHFVECLGLNTNKLTITVFSIDKPLYFLDLFEVEFGRLRIFNNNNISECSLKETVSVSGQELPIDVLKISTQNNENSAYLFQRKQPIIIFTDNVEKGTFYIEKGTANNTNISIDIECYDVIGNLSDEFLGGIYSKKTVKSLIADILSGTDVTCEIPESIGNMTVSGYIPITTKRQALVYVACATGCIFYKHPTLRIAELPHLPTTSFDKTHIFQTPNITTTQEIKGVRLTIHNFSAGSEVVEAYKWYMSTKEQRKIKFSEPLHSLKAYTVTETTENGITTETKTLTNSVSFLETGANYCIVKNSSTQKICIEGSKYVDSKDVIECISPYVTRYQPYTVKEIEGFTLMADDYSDSILTGMYNYYTKNSSFSGEVLINYSDIYAGECITALDYTGVIKTRETDFGRISKIEVI